jgi:tight adherence protein C
MQDIIALLENMTGGNLDDVTLMLVFIATSLLFFGVMQWLMRGMSPVQRRLQAIAETTEAHNSHQEGEFTVRWVEPVVKIILPKEGWKRSQLKTRLIRAGYRNPRALQTFLGAKLLLALAPLIILFLFFVASPFLAITPGFVLNQKFALTVLLPAAILGFYVPDLYIYRKVRNRQLNFIEAFPDAMDMLVVCVEAGLGLDAAIQRVGQEMIISHPELASEFNVLSLELRAGKSREEALRSLADRTGVADVQALTTLLIQAEHFGTSVASALSEHSTDMRIKRIQRAREKAAKLAVKLIFPIIFCIFPALFLVVLGPALVQIVKGFRSVTGG